MFKGYLESSILGKAVEKELISVAIINIRDFSLDKHRTCDDAPYGGGPGMLLKPEPLSAAIESIEKRGRVIYLSPAGKIFNQDCVKELSREVSLVLICGHYEGIDQRVIDLYVTDEVSVGDYVLFSGEVGAMVILDAVSRLVEGVISEESVREESFQDGLLEYPQYTRPQVFKNLRVPEVLISGNHANIRAWRMEKSLEKTLKFRPDLLKSINLSEAQLRILKQIMEEGTSYEHDKDHRSKTIEG